MLKLRIQGLPDEIAQLAQFLQGHPGITVFEVSPPYAHRGDSHYQRVYAEIARHPQTGSHLLRAKLAQEEQ
jgi:phage-related protein